MNKRETKKSGDTLNALDYFIIAAIILCLAGAAIRTFIGSEGNSLTSQIVMEDYVISYRISNIRNSSTEYLYDGAEFYQHATQQYFGRLTGDVSVTPAQILMEDVHGNLIQTYAPENGDATRVDVTGTMLVSGYMGENGFLLDGATPLAVNKAVTLRSRELYVTVTVTSITKAS